MTILGDTLEQTGLPRLIGWHHDGTNEDGLVRKATAAALYPFQLATSPIAIKTYITTILFLFTSSILLSVSTTAYGFFYYNYIPQTDLEQPIYLQYDTEHYPTADIPLDASALISQQPYDVSITLHMPHGPVNKASGNFMLDLSLLRNKDSIQSTILESVNLEQVIPSTVLHHSRRPALIPYSSIPTSLIHKMIRIPLHILTSSQSYDPDSVTLTVPMFEEVEFARGRDNIPTRAKLIIQTQRPSGTILTTQGGVALPIPHIEVYSAKLSFQVRFHGLRYLIYNHRILSFLVFSTLFYGVSISTVAVVWAALALIFRTKSPDDRAVVKVERSPTIKQEHDASDPLRTESDNTVKTAKRLSDESEDNAPTQGHTEAQGATGYTPQTSEEASLASSQVHAAVADISEEQADDEEEESEDEWQQLQRLRRKMEKEARERDRERQLMAERDSGLGTSLESDNRNFSGAGGGDLVRRRSNRKSDNGKD